MYLINKVKSMFSDSLGRNMFFSGLCKPASMLVSYIYVPIALGYLGVEKYGIWATILNILSWIGFFDIGIGNGLRNKLTESLNKEDRNNADPSKLISSAYFFISVIMVAVSIVFVIVAQFLNWGRLLGAPDSNEDLKKVVVISFLFVAFNFILSICRNVLYALQKAAFVSFMQLGIQLINLVGVIILRHFSEASLISIAILYGASQILIDGTAGLIIYCRNKGLRPRIKNISKESSRSLTSLGLQFFAIQICGLILYATDSLLISYIYGAKDVTPYATVNKLFMIVSGLYLAFISPIWASVTQNKTIGNISKIKKMLKHLNLLMIPFAAMAVIISVFFRPISFLWLREELVYSNTLIILGAAYCLLTIWTNVYATVLNGLEVMKIPVILSIVNAVINIPLSLFFGFYLGMESAGILAGTVICMLIAGIAEPILLHKEFIRLEKEN